MTLIIYKEGKLHADRLSLIEVGHGQFTAVKEPKVFNYGDHAIAVCGEFDVNAVSFKEFLSLSRIIIIGKSLKQWPVYKNLTPEAYDTIMAWFVMVGSSVATYLGECGFYNDTIIITRHAAASVKQRQNTLIFLHERSMPYFLGSGHFMALTAHRAGKTIEETYSIASEVQPTVSAEFDTISHDDVEEPPMNYIELIYEQLVAKDKHINAYPDLLKKAVKLFKECLSEAEVSLLFPELSKEV